MDTPARSPMYTVLVAAVLFLSIVPVGISAFILGFIHGDSPCVLCWQQRIGMALIALIGLFVLRYGPKPKYLGLAVLVAAYGVYMGLRHAALHLARDVGQGFAAELLGVRTYSWAFFIFWCCLLAIGALLLMARQRDLIPTGPRTLRPIDRFAMGTFLVVVAANAVQAFASTGPPPFAGQSDPVRFSFNPRHWVWSLEEYRAAPISLRGRWAIGKPDVTSVDPDPATSPLGNLPRVKVLERRPLGLPLRGTPTALDYDAATDRFLITTEHGVYLTNGALDRIERYTVVDPLFAVDLARFAGAAFLDSRTMIAVSENKSYVVLRESEEGGGIGRNFRYFLESYDDFDEVSRSRLATVRAKMMYVMSAAFDPSTSSLFTVTVPNARTRRLVVSRFDTTDMQLSEEFLPVIARDLPFAPADDSRPLDELYITAAAIADGQLYALSAAHSTLLTIDFTFRAVVSAHVIDDLRQPTGLAIKDGEFYILSTDATITRGQLWR
jgi:disulfide bond formation protein DsbB